MYGPWLQSPVATAQCLALNDINSTKWQLPCPDILASFCIVAGTDNTSSICLTQSMVQEDHMLMDAYSCLIDNKNLTFDTKELTLRPF